jgi:hypothetical protein
MITLKAMRQRLDARGGTLAARERRVGRRSVIAPPSWRVYWHFARPARGFCTGFFLLGAPGQQFDRIARGADQHRLVLPSRTRGSVFIADDRGSLEDLDRRISTDLK